MTTDSKWTEQKLQHMAQAYFDGSLSEADEQALRQHLSKTTAPTGAAAEAKAEMAFFAVARKRERKAAGTHPSARIVRVAVAAACAAMVGMAVWHYSAAGNPDCIIYAGGQTITNEQAVMAQMTAQMSEMGKQSDAVEQTVRNQLGDFRGLVGSHGE